MKPQQEALLDSLRSVTVWKHGAQRAPHKPLLLLMTLASVQRGEDRLTGYASIQPRLAQLLVDFGPARRAVHPEYPFWRLQNDGTFWEIPERDAALRTGSGVSAQGDVSSSVLRRIHARAGFSRPAYDILRNSPALVSEITAVLLEENFPASVHEDILDAVGMPWVLQLVKPSPRSAEFRDEITRLYEHRCAMCGFDGRLGHADLALEAAHIMWHAAGGPDDPSNGLLLCSIHHKAFDRGAVSLTNDRSIIVSQDLHGGPQVEGWIIDLGGTPVRRPLDPSALPGAQFTRWHRREVFRGPARLSA